MYYINLFIWNVQNKQIHRESRLMLATSCGRRRVMSTEFLFGVMKMICNWIVMMVFFNHQWYWKPLKCKLYHTLSEVHWVRGLMPCPPGLFSHPLTPLRAVSWRPEYGLKATGLRDQNFCIARYGVYSQVKAGVHCSLSISVYINSVLRADKEINWIIHTYPYTQVFFIYFYYGNFFFFPSLPKHLG